MIALLAAGLLLSTGALAAVPNPVTNLRITDLQIGSVTVAWNAPTTGDAATSYDVSVNGGAAQNTAQLQFTTALAAGNHTITVTSRNGDGVSLTPVNISLSVGPTTQPQGVGVTPGDKQLVVSWTPPTGALPGSFVRYEVQIDGGGWTSAGASLSYTFTNLVNQQNYTISVRGIYDTYTTPVVTVSGAPVGRPDNPTNLVVVPSDGTLDLSWVAPVNNGGSPILGYNVYYSGGGASGMINVPGTTAQLTGLTNATLYTVRVAAVNANGEGSPIPGRGTPARVPDAPENLNAQSNADGQLYVTWTAPTFNGGDAITDYEIFVDGVYEGNTGRGNVRYYTISGLTNNTSYNIAVRAVNAQGAGAFATTSASPVGAPTAPTNLVADALDGEVELSWDPPLNNGGSDITGYDIRLNGGTPTRVGTSGTYTYRNLANNQTYTFEVRARNRANYVGPWESVTATPVDIPVPPSAPRNPAADPGNGFVILTWQEPSNLGKAPVEYEFSMDGSLWIGIGTDTTYTVNGLTNGTSYTFYIRARNIAGAGPHVTVRSTPSQYAGTPPAPRNFRVDYYTGDMAILRWDPAISTLYAKYYEISVGGMVWDTVLINDLSYTLYGLDDKMSYDVYLRGVNDRGAGVTVKLTIYGSLYPAENKNELVEAATTPRQAGVAVYDVVAYSQPGGSAQVGTVYAGEPVGIIGSNAAGTWIRITFAEDGRAGWVPAGSVAAQ